MDENKKLALIEGILFISGDSGVSIDEISLLVEDNNSNVEDDINKLINKYESNDDHGITIQKFAKSFYRMITKKEHSEHYKKLAKVKTETKLSSASLETLSIIAYKGPISRPEVEDLRGVNCETIMYKLKLRNLIEEAGRSEKAGKPMNYQITSEFMKYFNINSIEELPKLEEFVQSNKDLFE